MPLLHSTDAFLFAATEACCSPFALFVQIQGFAISLLLVVGWSLASYVRRKEIKRLKEHGNSFAFLYYDISDLEHSSQVNLPMVSVVMPLKGSGEHNLHNWRSQITSLYGGPVEFLFVVESTEDPAYHAIKHLLHDFKDEVDAKIVVAALSTTCSQKIHNQLIGVERINRDTKYALFLDDDVWLHPGSIGALSAEMEKNPDIFIQTGYPLDLPSGSLGSYCIYEYHMPCSMGFATGGKTFFLWGGCMMISSIKMFIGEQFESKLGLISIYSRQCRNFEMEGYSDDMTLAAIAGAHKRLITSPPVAVFPHPLASDLNFYRYWNYLRKQTFVLESYTTKVNKILNQTLCVIHCYLSWAFVAPYFMSGIHVAAALRLHQRRSSLGEPAFPQSGLFLAGSLGLWTIITLFSMWNLTRIEVTLCNLLSPEAPSLSLAPYNWFLVFVALLVGNFLYPICAFRSHSSQYINWSGIRYYLKDGRICKIERNKGKGPKFTDLGGKSLYGRRGYADNYSVLKSLSRSYVQWLHPKTYDL